MSVPFNPTKYIGLKYNFPSSKNKQKAKNINQRTPNLSYPLEWAMKVDQLSVPNQAMRRWQWEIKIGEERAMAGATTPDLRTFPK